MLCQKHFQPSESKNSKRVLATCKEVLGCRQAAALAWEGRKGDQGHEAVLSAGRVRSGAGFTKDKDKTLRLSPRSAT